MPRRTFDDLSTSDFLRLQLDNWICAVENVPAEQRARCAESVACDLVTTMLRHPVEWPAMLTMLDAYPSAARCGVLIGASQVASGPLCVDLARRAAAMRMDLGREDWLDHIGSASPTGRAARDDTFQGLLVWLIELDDSLHRYTLMTGQDLYRGILQWAGVCPALDELARSETDAVRTEMSLTEAAAGMRAALEMPPMFGVSTSVQALGPFVRRRVGLLEPCDLAGPEEVSYQPARVHERVLVADPSG